MREQPGESPQENPLTTSQQQKIVRNKVGLLRLAEELGNVSRACKVMGYSRDTFYRYKEAMAEEGVEALLEKSRKGQRNFRPSRSATGRRGGGQDGPAGASLGANPSLQ